jgi:chromate transporter
VVVLLQLGGVALSSPAALALAGGAFIAVRYFKIDIIWVFAGGLAIWGGLLAVGLV